MRPYGVRPNPPRPEGQGKPKHLEGNPLDVAYRVLRDAAADAGEQYSAIAEERPLSVNGGPQTPILRAAAIVRQIAVTDAGRDAQKDAAHAEQISRIRKVHADARAALLTDISDLRDNAAVLNTLWGDAAKQSEVNHRHAVMWEKRAVMWKKRAARTSYLALALTLALFYVVVLL